jgi:tripartite-type tricarboxylate transporter receptor subunit TctC
MMFFPPTVGAQKSRDLAKHFESKPVTIIVGSAPGGGYDTFSRLVALFAAKYLPGNPRFIVKNVPGGGQLRGLRKTMKSKPDGLTIGLLHPRFVARELFGIDVPDFDLKKVRVLGTPSGGIKRPSLLCARRDLATSWDKILQLGRPVTVGANAPGGMGSTLGPEFVAAIGGPVKMIYGYGGAGEVLAAFNRGELDTIQYCSKAYIPRLYPEWITEKRAAPIFWWGGKSSSDYLGRLGADANFGRMGRLFVAPPGVEDHIYRVWKTAFEATVRDPEFNKRAAIAGMEVGLATAEDFRKNTELFQNLSSQTKGLVKKLAGM